MKEGNTEYAKKFGAHFQPIEVCEGMCSGDSECLVVDTIRFEPPSPSPPKSWSPPHRKCL